MARPQAKSEQTPNNTWGVLLSLPDGTRWHVTPDEAHELAAELKFAANECDEILGIKRRTRQTR